MSSSSYNELSISFWNFSFSYIFLGIITNQLLYLDISKLPHFNKVDFSSTIINNISVDCGGNLYYYFKQNPNIIKCNIDGIHSDKIHINDIDSLNINDIVKNYLKKDCKLFDNTNFSEIYDDVFLHLRAGSNWIKHNKNTTKIRLHNLKNTIMKLLGYNLYMSTNRNKKIISFSLYNDRPKDILNGVINCMLSPMIYPDWICRFYIDNTLPIEIIDILTTFDHVEICMMP